MDTIEYPLCLIIIFFKPLLFHHLFSAIIASTMIIKRVWNFPVSYGTLRQLFAFRLIFKQIETPRPWGVDLAKFEYFAWRSLVYGSDQPSKTATRPVLN